MKLSIIPLLFISSLGIAEIFDEFPEKINAQSRYMFYSHGFIVEGDNPTPIHPRWGKYDFPQIKQGLNNPSYHLVAHHRPAGTNPFDYAQAMAMHIKGMIEQGVKAENIVLIGFSRGGFITSHTSHLLAEHKIKTILMGTCGRIASNKYAHITLESHVLSVYEHSDGAQSCEAIAKRSKNITTFEEVKINTGLEHGAFFTANKAWLTPVKQWLTSHNFIPQTNKE